MSITTGNPESDEVQSHQQDLYKTIQNYLISLGLPQNTVLSLHAAHVHHEDVPNDLVKTPEGQFSSCSRVWYSRVVAFTLDTCG